MARKRWDIFLRASLRRQVDALTVNFSFPNLSLQPLLFWLFFFLINQRFHSRGQQLCKLIGAEESFYIRKRFSSHRTGLEHLEHQHGRRFIVLGHQFGRRDVM